MTLLDAREYDPARDRKRKMRIITGIVVLVVVLAVGWWFRYWPEERVVGHFFDALAEAGLQDGLRHMDAGSGWQKHPEQHAKYPFGDFYRDWGPGGEWGLIKTQKVFGASGCPGGGSGVVVDVVVNDRAQHAQVWVEKSDKTLSYPPCDLIFR